MESTCFLTPARRFEEISRLINIQLKRNSLIARGNSRYVSTRFCLPEGDHFVGFSWSYENVSDGVMILLEISKYYEEEKKKNTPPKLTKAEIINYAGNFKKWVETELPIVEAKIQQARSPVPLSVRYELGRNVISLSKREAARNPFKLNILPKIRVYYPEKFHDVSIQACKMLANNLKTFGVKGTISPVPYNEDHLPPSDDDVFECVIIPHGIEDKAALVFITEIKNRPKGIHIFDYYNHDNKYKFANLTAGILYNSGSELWRIHGLNQNDSIYVGIDLGHDHKLGKSKVCMTFIDKNGQELAEHRYISDNLSLNEKQQLTGILIGKLMEIKEKNGFENVIIHKDGRILEDHRLLYSELKKQFKSVSLVEVIKSNSAFILDPESMMGEIFDFGSFILLQTLPFSHLGKCTEPIKIKILESDLDRKFIIDNVFKLSKAFCGDSLYADKKLPITTHIADKFSSFQIGKTLQSFNIAKGVK